MSRQTCLNLGAKGLALAAALLCFGAQADTRTRVNSYIYDASWMLQTELREPDAPNDCLQTTHAYDARGNKTSVTTALCAGASGPTIASATTPRQSTTGYDADGRFATSSANALNHTETRAYDGRFGTATSLIGPNLLPTTWSYDGLGRKTLETRPDGTTTTWAYKLCTESGANCPGLIGGAASVWVSIEQSFSPTPAVANAPEKRQFYDNLNRLLRVQTQGFDGVTAAPVLVQDTEYNNLGQVSRKSDVYALSGGSAVWTTYTYDVLGRTISESRLDPTGGNATTTTAFSGPTVVVTNAKNQTKTTIKNESDQVAQVIDAQGSSLTYSYDALGNLLATKAAASATAAPVSSVTSMKYDVRGNKLFMLDPAMGSWEYRYNAYGELVFQRDSLSQVTTMVYDVLGRMTKRTEPDLVSDWSYDKYFDNSTCAKGIGKLCEAKADNTYSRKLSYDSQGRLSSTVTMLDVATTVSQTYDNNGRVATKTWPTGYQATNTYSALGFLKTVTGGGTNGFAQTATYNVLAMNAHGQVTQYRYGNPGNEVTTVKTVEPSGDRLTAQTVTRAGQSAGNVLNHTYSYDKLGNLATRGDITVGVGTQESFSYDSLNRLTTATLIGGGGNGNAATEVMYSPLGDITYKSDVGRFWYDAARPNRMTGVTLETAPGATIALSGTRQLSFAFDDYKPGAKTVSGITVGNGNLMYSVTYDAVNVRHNVRWETYTSFNMPSELKFGNFVTSGACLAGYTLSGGNCVMTVNTTTPATAPNTCPVGYTVSGSNCIKSGSTTIALSSSYTCPFGGTLVGTTCSQTSTITTALGGQNTSDRTLTFLYGPEHQRIKQNIVLTGNGTSSYFAGNVWYLNGEDSLGLGFEKEIRTNGTVENKHYVSAGGAVFAMFTSRSGTLNGLPATTTSYLHNDHLGSVAAITDETGAVTERLAYDPWGKRRFVTSNPGATDKLDAIVGQKTDRGYTMHEHLDEMGAIHMNGRIYDPLIARFMSADPLVQAPYNLKSFNRYSYVWNNSLKLWDPSGFDAQTGNALHGESASDYNSDIGTEKSGSIEKSSETGILQSVFHAIGRGFKAVQDALLPAGVPTAGEIFEKLSVSPTPVLVAGSTFKAGKALFANKQAITAEVLAAREAAVAISKQHAIGSGLTVTFGTGKSANHNAAHIADLAKKGVSVDEAEKAVLASVSKLAEKSKFAVDQRVTGTVQVNGVTVTYHGAQLTPTNINIGTFY